MSLVLYRQLRSSSFNNVGQESNQLILSLRRADQRRSPFPVNCGYVSGVGLNALRLELWHTRSC
ncbi:hypothetical protein SynBIOSE41_02109 [Synechococcus sp. BIOS-E4-1]|nr:hypothetical protein SynBIOSE41_02109 [Synechococcus sp. BIOS-E4-1]